MQLHTRLGASNVNQRSGAIAWPADNDALALQILPLFVVAALVEWLTRLVAHDAWPDWSQLPGPLLQAALWPLVGALLLAPQRRAFERDDIRPL